MTASLSFYHYRTNFLSTLVILLSLSSVTHHPYSHSKYTPEHDYDEVNPNNENNYPIDITAVPCNSQFTIVNQDHEHNVVGFSTQNATQPLK